MLSSARVQFTNTGWAGEMRGSPSSRNALSTTLALAWSGLRTSASVSDARWRYSSS